MSNLYNLELLAKYLKGELSGDEKTKIEAQIQNDKELRNELASLQLSMDENKAMTWKKAMPKDQPENIVEQNPSQSPASPEPKKMGNWVNFTRIATFFILIIGLAVFVLFYTTNPESFIASQNFNYTLPMVRSSGIEMNPIEEAYLDENFIQIIGLEQPVPNQNLKELFLVALSYLELNQATEAEKRLKFITDQNTGMYSDEIDFFRVKIHLLLKDYIQAEILMEEIMNNPNHTYYLNFNQVDIWKLKIINWKE